MQYSVTQENDVLCTSGAFGIDLVVFLWQTGVSVWYCWVVFMFRKECEGIGTRLEDDDDGSDPLVRFRLSARPRHRPLTSPHST